MTAPTIAIEPLNADQLHHVQAIWERAMVDESLLIDDLEAIVAPGPVDQCAIDATSDVLLDLGPTHVWVTADRQGAIIVSERHLGDFRQAHIQLLVVHPDAQRRGYATALIDHVTSWAVSNNIAMMQVGGAAPYYLYTGVDTRWIAAQCFFEKLGFNRTMVELDLFCGTRPRAVGGSGISVSRVIAPDDVEALQHFAEAEYPQWIPEYLRGVEHGTVMIARNEDGVVVGAGAHSVNRFGVIGPIGVSSTTQRGGVGAAVMAELLKDLSIAGVDRAEIAWTSTVRFYERSCGAWVGRAVQLYSKSLA